MESWMKRGFLRNPKSSPKLKKPSEVADTTFKTPAIPFDVVETNVPDMAPFPEGRDLMAARLPVYTPMEPYTVFLLYTGAKEAILAIPGFPTSYRPFLRVHYRIGDAPGTGKGMFALKDLDVGDLILRERPLCLLPRRFATDSKETAKRVQSGTLMAMEPQDFDDFLKLKNSKNGDDPLEGIISTNSLDALRMPGPYEGEYCGICRDLCRVNHSCSPNAYRRWILKDIMYELRAIRPIKKGEQIFISYINHLEPRSARQNKLQSDYAFVCGCPSCSLPPSGISCSDTRRMLLGMIKTVDNPNDDSMLNAWVEDKSLPDDHIISQSMEYIKTMDLEGFVDEDVCKLNYSRLAKAYCALKDTENAKLWAKRTAQIITAIDGNDYGWKRVAYSPELTDWWGRRNT